MTAKDLDKWFPPRGPCGLCGHPDARHRIWDAIIDRPESEEELAEDYELPIEAIKAVRNVRPYRR